LQLDIFGQLQKKGSPTAAGYPTPTKFALRHASAFVIPASFKAASIFHALTRNPPSPLNKMSKEAEKSENVVAMEIEESEEAREERLKQESIAIAIAGMCLKHPFVLRKAISSECVH
jgi:hypothetical protein